MALKIRLRQQGRTNRAFYRLVVTDSRSPRDGKYVEALGWYNPIEDEQEKKIYMKPDRVQHWLSLGAQMTEKAAMLIKQSAPEVIQQYREKEMTKRTKLVAERRRRKKVAA